MEKDIRIYLNSYMSMLQIEDRPKNYMIMTKTHLNQFIDHFANLGRDIRILKPNDVREYFSYYKAIGKWKKLSTHLAKYSLIKKFYKFLVAEKVIEENPLDKMQMPSNRSERVKKFISPKDLIKLEEIAFLNKSLSLRTKTIFFLVRSTGMRSQEAADLLRKDVNMGERYLLIRTSKNHKPKYVPFSKVAAVFLKEWLSSTRIVNTDYIFFQKRNYNKSVIRQTISQAINEVFGILWTQKSDDHPDGAHVLRHTFVQEWCEKGGDWRGLQFIMGWSSLKPLESYLRMSPQLVRKHYRAIENKKWGV